MFTRLKLDRELLTAQEVADRLAVGVRTLQRMVERGEVPQPIRFSRKLIRWRMCDVADYIEGLRERPAS
jgi:excisionase family DNA binding protein